MAKTELTELQWRRVKARLADNVSVAQIARDMGLRPALLFELMRVQGIDPRLYRFKMSKGHWPVARREAEAGR
jgi:hypothetical protein